MTIEPHTRVRTITIPRGITITSLALLSWGLVAALTYVVGL